MKYYIEIGDSGRIEYHLQNVTKVRLPSLKDEKVNRYWIGYVIQIMDDLATDYNYYMMFRDVFPHFPNRMYTQLFNESILSLCKLLDYRKDNKLSLNKILNNIEQNINKETNQVIFNQFKNDVCVWLNSEKEFIDQIITIRDKLVAHIDTDQKSKMLLKQSLLKLDMKKFCLISNIIIEIYCAVITSVNQIIIPSGGYLDFDEFNFIYECLRSLDKIDKNITKKNIIIHNIDLELQEIKRLIKND